MIDLRVYTWACTGGFYIVSNDINLSAEYSGAPFSSSEFSLLSTADLSSLLKSTTAQRVLLSRVRATLFEKEKEVQQSKAALNKVVDTTRVANSSPMASAISALGMLRLEDQQQVFTVHGEQLLSQARELSALAYAERRAALAAVRHTRAILHTLAQAQQQPGHIQEYLKSQEMLLVSLEDNMQGQQDLSFLQQLTEQLQQSSPFKVAPAQTQ